MPLVLGMMAVTRTEVKILPCDASTAAPFSAFGIPNRTQQACRLTMKERGYARPCLLPIPPRIQYSRNQEWMSRATSRNRASNRAGARMGLYLDVGHGFQSGSQHRVVKESARPCSNVGISPAQDRAKIPGYAVLVRFKIVIALPVVWIQKAFDGIAP